MVSGCEQEGEARPPPGSVRRNFRLGVEPRHRARQDVRAAGAARLPRDAVFDDWNPAGRGDDGGRGRDIDRARAVATGSARVEEVLGSRLRIPTPSSGHARRGTVPSSSAAVMPFARHAVRKRAATSGVASPSSSAATASCVSAVASVFPCGAFRGLDVGHSSGYPNGVSFHLALVHPVHADNHLDMVVPPLRIFTVCSAV